MAVERLYIEIKSSLIQRASALTEEASKVLAEQGEQAYELKLGEARDTIAKASLVDDILPKALENLRDAGIEEPPFEMLIKIVDDELAAKRQKESEEKERAGKRAARKGAKGSAGKKTVEGKSGKERVVRRELGKVELAVAKALFEINDSSDGFRNVSDEEVVSAAWSQELAGIESQSVLEKRKRQYKSRLKNTKASLSNKIKRASRSKKNPEKITELLNSLRERPEYADASTDKLIAVANREITFEQLVGNESYEPPKRRTASSRAKKVDSAKTEVPSIEGDDFKLDGQAKTLSVGLKKIDLSAKELEFMAIVAAKPNEQVTPEKISEAVYGDSRKTTKLPGLVSKLRGKLGETGTNQRYLRSLGKGAGARGNWYMFTPSGELPGSEISQTTPTAAPSPAIASQDHVEPRREGPRLTEASALAEETELVISPEYLLVMTRALKRLPESSGNPSLITTQDMTRINAICEKLEKVYNAQELQRTVTTEDIRNKLQAIVDKQDKAFLDNFDNPDNQFIITLIQTLNARGALKSFLES